MIAPNSACHAPVVPLGTQTLISIAARVERDESAWHYLGADVVRSAKDQLRWIDKEARLARIQTVATIALHDGRVSYVAMVRGVPLRIHEQNICTGNAVTDDLETAC